MAGSFLGGADFGGLGGAVSSIFGGIGDLQEAKSYTAAAKLAKQNALISAESTRIKMTQADRQIYQTIGKQQAQVAGAGLASSGTALDLLRSSQSQGELTRQLIGTQGVIDKNDFLTQAANYSGMASAAQASGSGGILGGLIQGVGAIASVAGMFSDERLKEDITLLGPSGVEGVNLYSFRYLGQPNVYEGVIAQEVAKVRPDMVGFSRDGFYKVDYDGLGLKLKLVDHA